MFAILILCVCLILAAIGFPRLLISKKTRGVDINREQAIDVGFVGHKYEPAVSDSNQDEFISVKVDRINKKSSLRKTKKGVAGNKVIFDKIKSVREFNGASPPNTFITDVVAKT